MKNQKKINIWETDFKKNQGGFKTPDTFLEGFEDRMMKTISRNELPRSKKIIPLRSWLLYAASVAASIILGLYLWNLTSSSNTEYQFSELEWDQAALFEDSWILEELNLDEDSELASYEEIDFLLAQGVTNDEILEAFQETDSIE